MIMNKFKVVFHMDNQVKVGGVLNNIRNLINDIGIENLDIQLAMKGDAVKAFVRNTSEFEPLLKDLAEKHVKFSACANAMRNFGIKTDELLNFVMIDSSGGREIVRKKAAGWSYICP